MKTTGMRIVERVMSRMAALAIWGLAAAVLTVAVTVILSAWDIAGFRTESLGELTAQMQLLIAAFQLALAAAVTVATIYYARTSREAVSEMRAARDADAERARETAAAVHEREVRAVVGQLLLATNRAVAALSSLRVVLRGRPVWLGKFSYGLRVNDAWQTGMSDVGAAVNQLAYLDEPAHRLGEQIYDELLGAHALTTALADETTVLNSLRRLSEVRSALESELRSRANPVGAFAGAERG